MGWLDDIGKRPTERPQKVRLVASAASTTDLFASFFFSCSTAMGFLTLLFGYAVHSQPTEFLPANLINKKFYELRPRRMIVVPFFVIGVVNFCSGYITHSKENQFTGNMVGLTANLFFGLSLIGLRKITWLYTAMGSIHLTFAFLHHYRRLCIMTDNASLFCWSDFAEIREDRKRRKLQQKNPNYDDADSDGM
jgi:hypothetical protein